MLSIVVFILGCRAFYRLAHGNVAKGLRFAVSGLITFYIWEYIVSLVFYDSVELIERNAFYRIPGFISRYVPMLIAALITWMYYDQLKLALRNRKPHWTI